MKVLTFKLKSLIALLVILAVFACAGLFIISENNKTNDYVLPEVEIILP